MRPVGIASLVASIAAAVLALAGLLVMRAQLRAAHNLNRGIQLRGGYTGGIKVVGTGDHTRSTKDYRMSIWVVGPGTMSNVQPWIEGVPPYVSKMFDDADRVLLAAADDRIVIEFELPENFDTSGILWGVRWFEPHRQSIRSCLVATNISETKPVMWEWTWRVPFRPWFHYERLMAQLRKRDRRPIGKWKRRSGHALTESQSPLNHLPSPPST